MKLSLTVLMMLVASAGSPSLQAASLGRIDLVTVGVADLEQGVAELERLTGVRASYGGIHPTRGTHNALLALGNGAYMEVLAERPDSREAHNAHLRALKRPTPLYWGVGVIDAEQVAARLEAQGLAVDTPIAGSRRTDSGGLLEWRTFGLREPLQGAPFFIQWATGSAHPSRSAAAGCTLLNLDIATPDAMSVQKLMRSVDSDVRVRREDVLELALHLRCPKGAVSLSSREEPAPDAAQ